MNEPRLVIADDFALPVDAVTQTFALLAQRGAGKTYAAAVMVEEMLGVGLPVAVIDPVGVWWGLRSSADGAQPGLPIVVLGGDHGDLPLNVDTGAVIAEVIIDDGVAAVLDLSLLRKGEQTRFMTDFAERLYHRCRRPLHLVLDEADAFAPQRPLPGQQRMLGAVEDLVRRGRARGIGVSLITQRPAVLNKDVLTQAAVLVALRLVAPQDREALDAWIKAHGEPDQRDQLLASLASLPVGEAWIWSPGWLGAFQRVRVRRRRTFDSSATPKVGETRVEPNALAAVDLAALATRLSITRDHDAEDAAFWRRRVDELERQLAARAAPPETLDRFAELLTTFDHRIEAMRALVEASAADLLAEGARLRACLQPPSIAAMPEPPTPRSMPESGVAPARAGERRMVETLAAFAPRRLSRGQLATLTGMSASGGTFTTYLGALRRRGLIEETNDGLTVTAAGAAWRRRPPLSRDEILNLWQSALRAGERRMLDALIAAYPEALSKDELGFRVRIAPTGGTFGTYLGVLRRNGLIESIGRDRYRASPTLYLTERAA